MKSIARDFYGIDIGIKPYNFFRILVSSNLIL